MTRVDMSLNAKQQLQTLLWMVLEVLVTPEEMSLRAS